MRARDTSLLRPTVPAPLASTRQREPGRRTVRRPVIPDQEIEGLRQHTVICGHGWVGRESADALERRKFRYLVVEYTCRPRARDVGVRVIYGDAANPAVLDHVNLKHARVLAVVMPDAHAAEAATRYARARYPRLDIVVRVAGAEQMERLRRAGASEVVQPDFEAGVEIIHTLRRYGIAGLELLNATAGRRAAYYQRALGSEETELGYQRHGSD